MKPTSLDAMMASLTNCLDRASLQSVVEMRAPPETEARIDWLAERANEGELTNDERSEYESFVRISNFINVLKLQARDKLGQG